MYKIIETIYNQLLKEHKNYVEIIDRIFDELEDRYNVTFPDWFRYEIANKLPQSYTSTVLLNKIADCIREHYKVTGNFYAIMRTHPKFGEPFISNIKQVENLYQLYVYPYGVPSKVVDRICSQMDKNQMTKEAFVKTVMEDFIYRADSLNTSLFEINKGKTGDGLLYVTIKPYVEYLLKEIQKDFEIAEPIPEKMIQKITEGFAIEQKDVTKQNIIEMMVWYDRTL